jgi:hypothetical protein
MQFDQLTWREFITLLGGAAAAWALEHGRGVRRCRRSVTSAAGQRLFLMHATSFGVRLLLAFGCAVLAPPTVSEDTGVGPPPAPAPGQAPPLPKPGSLAEPRSSDQVGFPTALTQYVISPTTLRPARVTLGQKLFFEPRLSGEGPSPAPPATIRRGPSPTAGPCQSASMAASANAMPQPC